MAYLNESHVEVADIDFFVEQLGYTHINPGRNNVDRNTD
jgi:type I restriction enzyme, R subunit